MNIFCLGVQFKYSDGLVQDFIYNLKLGIRNFDPISK